MNFLRHNPTAVIFVALLALGAGGVLLAQAARDGGARTSLESSSNFEVTGIVVDTSGENAREAREEGWREAQRRAWRVLYARVNGGSPQNAPSLGDSALNGIVAGIIIEDEQIGSTRYVARLGVMFDRARVSQYLGVSGQVRRSPPMLVIPVQWIGSTPQSFEERTAWQQAWLRFRTGSSPIDYVRASASGPTPLLLTMGQTGRPGRGWWRFLLDSYGAADVVVPMVYLHYAYPGGPVVGRFVAYHGPDRNKLADFSLRVSDADSLDALLDAGVRRIDAAYTAALEDGRLRPDPSLNFEFGLDEEETEEELEEIAESVARSASDGQGRTTAPVATGTSFTIQVATPDASAVRSNEAAVRGIPGVRSAITSSLAIGGVSLMDIRFDGDLDALATALSARGFQVQRGGGTLRITRGGGGAPADEPPAAPGNEPPAAPGG
ncbi:MAG: heavy-metal-associated domain-containing protein [Parasphingopyxis sp.]|nr:heavy-metal-associated domain-containing protein [Sphingomonadales bacterium]